MKNILTLANDSLYGRFINVSLLTSIASAGSLLELSSSARLPKS